MQRNLFRSHLYNQIVLPLMVASVLVGVVATVVAVYMLTDLTDRWVAHLAENTTEHVAHHYEHYTAELAEATRAAEEDHLLQQALASNDVDLLVEALGEVRREVGADRVTLFDENGRALISVPPADFEDPVIPVSLLASAASSKTSSAFVSTPGGPAITAVWPLASPNGRRTIAVSTNFDDELLGEMSGGTGDAFCLFGPTGRNIACTQNEALPAAEQAALLKALSIQNPAVEQAVAQARSGEPGTGEMRVGSADYRILAIPMAMGGPEGMASTGYLVGMVNQQVTDEARKTTISLITMWSILAVVALVGLGGWVARSVSDPLVELATGARTVAEGDFSARVQVTGSNEVSVLADSFNQMTESLSDRSESLTKKVLELAALYEMSRSLGATLELDALLNLVLDAATRIFDVDLGYVTLRDKSTGKPVMHAFRGEMAETTDAALRTSLSEWVVREGRPLIFNPETAGGDDRLETVSGARAALCVPLVAGSDVLGSITVGSRDGAYRFDADDVRLLSTIANHVTMAIGNIELFSSLQDAYLATVRSLAAAVDAKDPYTRGHSDRVAYFASLIGTRMGLSHEQRVALEMAAYLHDIGKIGIKEEILLKPGRLTDDEMAQMRHHPLIGANILQPVAFPWQITPVVRHHHERWDGDGYPAGLRGEEIPLLARILTVADSYEAMTADRPYRQGLGVEAAIEELNRCAGSQFDTRIVEVFIEVVEDLERAGEAVTGDEAEEISSEEARAIFAAIIDGVFDSFRRLGGRRLAANVERELDTQFARENLPFRVRGGRTVFLADAPLARDAEVERMRIALRQLDDTIGRLAGTTLLDHFYVDALDTLTGRMRRLATELGLRLPN